MSRLPRFFVATVLGLGLGSAGCSQAPPSTKAPQAQRPGKASLPDRDPQLARRLVHEEGALLLDVRTPQEFAEGHVDGAQLIPVQELARRLGEVAALQGGARDKPIVVMCRSGARATRAKALLEEAGYTRVTNVGAWTAY